MATKSLNRVHVATATTGTGTLTLGAASAANVITFLQAGGVDGDVVNYVIEEGADFEIGSGVLGGTSTTLTRDTVHISKIGAAVSTTKMNLAGAARVRSAEPADLFNHLFPAGELVKTAAYTIVGDDRNKVLLANSASAFTLTLTAAATLGVFAIFIRNINTGAITIDPNSTELIDGASTSIVLAANQSVMLVCNGTAWRTLLADRYGLSGQADVDFTTVPPANGDGLVYDSTAGKWKPGPAGGGMFRGNNGTVGSRVGDIFRVNAKTLTANTTIAATENASAAGPLEVATGVTLEVATGGTLVIL